MNQNAKSWTKFYQTKSSNMKKDTAYDQVGLYQKGKVSMMFLNVFM